MPDSGKSWRPEGVDPIALLELGTPIKAYAETLTELPFWRRPNAGDLEALEDNDAAEGAPGMVQLLHRLTRLPTATIRTLDAFDFNRADRVVSHFLRRGPAVEIARSLLRLSLESSPGSTSPS